MLPLSVHPTCRADEAHVRNRIQHTAPAACATIVSRACHAAVCRQLLHDLPEQTAWAAASHAAAWRAEAAHEPGLPRRAGHDERWMRRLLVQFVSTGPEVLVTEGAVNTTRVSRNHQLTSEYKFCTGWFLQSYTHIGIPRLPVRLSRARGHGAERYGGLL